MPSPSPSPTPPLAPTAERRDQWMITGAACHLPDAITSTAQARFLLSLHAGHGPDCPQFHTALTALDSSTTTTGSAPAAASTASNAATPNEMTDHHSRAENTR